MLWFLSGVVMMYARMPALDPEERLLRLPALDLEAARIEPAQAAATAPFHPQRLRIGMLDRRPVYRLASGSSWHTVFADSGQVLRQLSAQQALGIARSAYPQIGPVLAHGARLTRPDQWTLQTQAFLPVHRIDGTDSARTRLYVSERTGEIVMVTTRRSRVWGYLGPVVHWAYFTPLRSSGWWLNGLIWTSIAGCFLTLSGLVVGVWRLQWRRRARGPRSPYSGLLRWHHYFGLAFGAVTFTWILSGCLSLDPWSWHSGTGPTLSQRQGLAGGPLQVDELRLDSVHEAASALAAGATVKELDLVRYQGELHLLAHRPPSASETLPRTAGQPLAFLSPVLPLALEVVRVGHYERRAQVAPEVSLRAAASTAMPEWSILDATWLRAYDAYYSDRDQRQPLPVLRVKYDDPAATWLYFDPARGMILRKEDRRTRLNRWLYRGLHSLDFPRLYSRRPLWDVVALLLLAGGLALSASTLAPGLKRLQHRLVALSTKTRR